jgi:hypothetical protein
MNLKYLLVLIFIAIYSTSYSQITWDTTADLSRHEGGYGKFRSSVKASVFSNGNLGFEVVRVRNKLSLVWLMNNTATKYYGLQWINNRNYKYGLFGLKAGGDIDFSLIHLGFSATAQTDLKSLRFYAAPEAGISWWGTVGIYYSFILPLGNKEFIGNDNYQLGIKYNFTKDLFREFKDGVAL